jgi:hypothetical protein
MPELHHMPFVLLESPFAGKTPEDLARNRQYALDAMRHSLYLGEAPFASHLLYTQMLDDDVPLERSMGIEAGLAIGLRADLTAVYHDLGISRGMEYGIEAAKKAGREIIYRSIR